MEDVNLVINYLLGRESPYYERLWEQLTGRQRALLQALAAQGSDELFSQRARDKYRLGPASSVQKALQSLTAKDILDRYQDRYFLVDPLLTLWIRKKAQ